MAGLIPQSFIDDLVARIDIVQVIGARVALKKAGRDYKACCPFHDEKTPSFTVSPGKQFYHCFGCGAHGTALGFLMQHDRLDFVEAVEELATTLGLAVPREGAADRDGAQVDSSARKRREQAWAALDAANRWYKRQLREHSDAIRASEYLKARGMSGRSAAHFEVGFAPEGWSHLLDALQAQGFDPESLHDAGLLAESDRGPNRRYDRFRDRIMFPIHDRRGRVVGFGARAMGDATPKYLNSPESVVFHKGRELYGLHQLLRAHPHPARVIAVEGYMDVVMLWEHGVDDACATLGTAATPEQMERLFRTSDTVIFCFDGDEAGRRAAWRALENTLALMRDGRQARFLFLPEGDDPDSYIAAHAKPAFEELIAGAPTLTDFLFAQLRHDADLRSVEGRARVIEKARPLLTRLPQGALRAMAVERLANMGQLPVARLEALLGLKNHPLDSTSTQTLRQSRARRREVTTPARRAITLLLHHPQLAQRADNCDDLASLDIAGATLLADMLHCLAEHPTMSTAGLIERFRNDALGSALEKLASLEVPVLDEGLTDEFLDCLERLRHAPLEARFQELRERDRDGELSESERNEFKALIVARSRRH